MAQLRFKGFQTGTRVHLSDITIGTDSASVDVPAFKAPAAVSGLPRVNSTQNAGSTLTLDTTGMTGITAYDWRQVGGATLGTAATLDTMGHAMKWIECEVTCNEGVLVSPAVHIYMTGMMPAHDVDDLAVLAAFMHSDATHIAIASGLWSVPTTWLGGRVPASGARVLVPHGLTVTYDNSVASVRLDWLRVDGTVERSTSASTTMLVETIFASRGASWVTASAASPLASNITHEVIFSGRNYQDNSFTDTDIDMTRDTRLWGRGLIVQGTWDEHAAEKDPWIPTIESTAAFNGTTWDFAGISAGDTSLTLERAPAGWQVGDTIIIPGTEVTYGPPYTGPLGREDEERVLTNISGNVLTWADPLVYNHDNQLSGSTRSDLPFAVALKEGRNISYRSEVTTPVWRRGHTTSMHHHNTTKISGVQWLDLGRTDKSTDGGVIDENGDWFHFDGVGGEFVREPLTARANLLARYSQHYHHVGEQTGVAEDQWPYVKYCYVGGNPGHAYVHHGSAAHYDWCVGYDFFGAGLVSESGNERGRWNKCMMIGATSDRGHLESAPKIQQDGGGAAGDLAQHGYGFFSRSRAILSTDNIAASVSWAFVFNHRMAVQPGTYFALPIELERADLDLQTSCRVNTSIPTDKFGRKEFPIHTWQGNASFGTLSGLFITKGTPMQFHDVNATLKDFTAYGFQKDAISLEYVNRYNFKHIDLVGGRGGALRGLTLDTNFYQGGGYEITVEGADHGMHIFGGNTVLFGGGQAHDEFTPDDPRYTIVGYDWIDCGDAYEFIPPVNNTKDFLDVAYYEENPNNDLLDFNLYPTHTFPRLVGEWNGGQGYTSLITNASGKKVDNISALGEMFDPIHEDTIFADDAYGPYNVAKADGIWDWNDGGTNRTIVAQYEIIGDRATARYSKYLFAIEVTAGPNDGSIVNNGTINITDTPVVVSHKVINTAEGTPVTADVVAGAAGGAGAGTYQIDPQGDYIRPRRGTLTWSGNSVTYTPNEDFTGTDEAVVFIESHNSFATMHLSFLVGDASAPEEPVVDTHFLTYDHADANTIGIQLIERPNIGDRNVEWTEYSTDGGTTWRRLCFGWKRKIHKVTLQSDGTAVDAGVGTYHMRIRYTTDHDNVTQSSKTPIG